VVAPVRGRRGAQRNVRRPHGQGGRSGPALLPGGAGGPSRCGTARAETDAPAEHPAKRMGMRGPELGRPKPADTHRHGPGVPRSRRTARAWQIVLEPECERQHSWPVCARRKIGRRGMVEYRNSSLSGPGQRLAPTGTVNRLRKPLAILLLAVLLGQWGLPVFARGEGQAAPARRRRLPRRGPRRQRRPSRSPPRSTPRRAPQPTPLPHDVRHPRKRRPPALTTSSVEAFPAGSLHGAAAAEIPIALPPGTAGVAPKVVLRYNSGAWMSWTRRPGP